MAVDKEAIICLSRVYSYYFNLVLDNVFIPSVMAMHIFTCDGHNVESLLVVYYT